MVRIRFSTASVGLAFWRACALCFLRDHHGPGAGYAVRGRQDELVKWVNTCPFEATCSQRLGTATLGTTHLPLSWAEGVPRVLGGNAAAGVGI